jgi:branched-chain amino acid transport system ATP-binding protein
MTVLLEAKGLCRHFGALKAVQEVSFQVMDGEIFGLIGPNGAGKTTLFNLITGLTPVSSGTFTYRGEKLTGLPPHCIAQRGIGRTFQNIRLFKGLNALDNIKAAQHVTTKSGLLSGILGMPGSRAEEKRVDQKAWEILDLIGLTDRASELAGNFCYGDQRRLEIGRALAMQPRVLLLDEPAAGMNTSEKHNLTEFIRSIRQQFQLTVLLIEHHVPLVMNLCDRIAVLNFGELITVGDPVDVQKNHAVIEAYLGAE